MTLYLGQSIYNAQFLITGEKGTDMIMVVAAISGFLAVALGAFGAHGLKTVLSPEMMTVYQTSVHYHLIHSVVLLVVAVASVILPATVWLTRSAMAFSVGIVLFSGSLYLMVFTEIKALGMITPIGGVSLLIGWLMLVIAGLKLNTQRK